MSDSRHHANATYQEKIPTPRRIPFEFPDDLNPRWIPDEPELTAMMNGASLTMPYLEPFLIRSMREAVEQVDDGLIKENGRAFNMQEQNHYRTHRRFNELLKASRYPELEAVETAMQESYKRLSRRSLRARMAYTAGFESMTLGVTKWLIEERVKLFAGADTRVVSFVLWHMVEETEHKCVAFDVYRALYKPSLGNYLARMIGVFHGSLDVMRFSRRGYKVILRKDGLSTSLRSWLRLMIQLGSFARHVAPYLLRAALPGHNPRHENDPQWVLDWLAGHAQADPDTAPLLDTHDPDMPVPFPIKARTRQVAA